VAVRAQTNHPVEALLIVKTEPLLKFSHGDSLFLLLAKYFLPTYFVVFASATVARPLSVIEDAAELWCHQDMSDDDEDDESRTDGCQVATYGMENAEVVVRHLRASKAFAVAWRTIAIYGERARSHPGNKEVRILRKWPEKASELVR